jgi:hypothetical protein
MHPEPGHERDDERDPHADAPEGEAPEDRPDEPGAEGGSQSPTRDKLPGMPARDDPSPVGDTDQHSSD